MTNQLNCRPPQADLVPDRSVYIVNVPSYTHDNPKNLDVRHISFVHCDFMSSDISACLTHLQSQG